MKALIMAAKPGYRSIILLAEISLADPTLAGQLVAERGKAMLAPAQC